jgi:DNA-binding NtrC family response regulator
MTEENPAPTDMSAAARWDGRTLEQVILDAERSALEAALAAHEGNITHTARALATSRMSVYRMLDRTGLRPFGSHTVAAAGGAE